MTKSLEIYRSTRTTVIKAGRVSTHRGSLPFLRYLHKFHPKYLSAFDEKAIQGEELYQKLHHHIFAEVHQEVQSPTCHAYRRTLSGLPRKGWHHLSANIHGAPAIEH